MSVDIYNEFEIIQNDLVGVHALHEFVKLYSEWNYGTGPKLIWLFPVLPILFNREASTAIHSKNLDSASFIKIINEKTDLFLNLQSKMEASASKTFRCIRLAGNSNLFNYNPENGRIFLIKKPAIIPSFVKLSEDYQNILLAARRLGTWFSKISEQELLIYLNIQF